MEPSSIVSDPKNRSFFMVTYPSSSFSSSSPSSSSSNNDDDDESNSIQIPVEIVTDEEMAFLEAALSSVRSLLSSQSPSFSSSSPLVASLSVLSPRHARSLSSAAALRRLRSPPPPDIEDISLLRRFRSRKALSVTDITAAEWCEKQMEFVLLRGKPKTTKAMKAGSKRHIELEKEGSLIEVVEKVKIKVKSIEESWAVKFIHFIVGANQLLSEGLTREIPVIGVVEGAWMIGIIDELKISGGDLNLNPHLVDTKTRCKATLSSEAQKRNARFQLMCYKYLWDYLAVDNFPTEDFFNYFCLDPHYFISDDVRQHISSLGFEVKTLKDVVLYFRSTCCLLSPAQEQLLLRYELQSDHSILEEYWFSYDAAWFNNEIKECLQFWHGQREARYVSNDDRWKCQSCKFTTMCHATVASRSNAE